MLEYVCVRWLAKVDMDVPHQNGLARIYPLRWWLQPLTGRVAEIILVADPGKRYCSLAFVSICSGRLGHLCWAETGAIVEQFFVFR